MVGQTSKLWASISWNTYWSSIVLPSKQHYCLVREPGLFEEHRWLDSSSDRGLPGFPPTWVFGLKSLLGTGLFTGLFAGAMKVSDAWDASEQELETEEEEDEGESQSKDPTPEAV